MPTRVLIVDDQILPRQLFESIIASSDDYVLTASVDTARVADIWCAAGKVDLILMDIVMKDGISGLDAAARIKQSYPSVKIILVTSMPDAMFLREWFSVRACHWRSGSWPRRSRCCWAPSSG